MITPTQSSELQRHAEQADRNAERLHAWESRIADRLKHELSIIYRARPVTLIHMGSACHTTRTL